MSKEDYMSGDTNISIFARKNKKFYGHCNFIKAVNIFDTYDLEYKIVEQGIKFKIDGIKYTYWTKKNRVYKINEDTKLTLDKFIKLNNSFFILKNGKVESIEIIEGYKLRKALKEYSPNDKATGKHKDKTWSEVNDIDPNYIKWMITATKDKKLKNMLELLD